MEQRARDGKGKGSLFQVGELGTAQKTIGTIQSILPHDGRLRDMTFDPVRP
jgi:hypothetical protein